MAKKTHQNIIDASFKILLLEGYEHLTYTHIAEKTGVSRSCVNGHFKKKEELLDELKPKAVEHIIQALEFSSPEAFYLSWVKKGELLDELRPKAVEHIIQALEFSSPEAFYLSWVNAVNEDRMFRNLIQNVGEIICSAEGRMSLTNRISGDSKEAEKALYMAIGYAVVHISCPIC
ncbi:TetR/AcrR family transcriptional regulator [Vibrio vulnificus]|uniref:TetR/AcrR family transcriptional regulator n=1 Tax=Vibrio vulnificus TaxID=672 RepID=UPI001EEB445F|nr:TetR/AcrR family transcriptional regulator [Vibrio vulnificus]